VEPQPVSREELEANLDLIHEVARDSFRRAWAFAEEKRIDPSDFVQWRGSSAPRLLDANQLCALAKETRRRFVEGLALGVNGEWWVPAAVAQ
jgi:hypothetical protein